MRLIVWNVFVLVIFWATCMVFLGTEGFYIAAGCTTGVIVYALFFGKRRE